jgi:Mn2+/Fe2+ NRAMP family transporter
MQNTAWVGSHFNCYALSEQAITIELGYEISENVLQKITAFNQFITQNPFPGFYTTVPAYTTLTTQNLKQVSRGALSAVGLASLMRILLFLAALGVISAGGKLDPGNPAASIFQIAGGMFGYKIFGLVIFAAGISSVVGSAYTSVSFIKIFHPVILKFNRQFIIVFIVISCIIFLIIGKPIKTLIAVGAINGFILPLSLGIMLLAAYRSKIVADYKQPIWLTLAGITVVATMAWMSYGAIMQVIGQPHLNGGAFMNTFKNNNR